MRQGYISKSAAFVAIIFILISGSCIEDEFSADKLSKSIELSPVMVIPLAYGELSIVDIVPDTVDYVRFNEDTIEIYINDDTVTTLSANDFFELPDTSAHNLTFDLGNRYIDPINISQTIPIPYPNPDSIPDVPMATLSEIDSVEFESGMIHVSITNNFPVQIDQIKFKIKNTLNNSIVAAFSFNSITVSQTKSDSVSVANAVLRSETYISVDTLTLAGGSTSPGIIDFNLFTTNLIVRRGRAVLPTQEFDSDTSAIQLDLEGDEEITEIGIKRGYLRFSINSYIAEDIRLNVLMPNTTRNGIILDTSIIVDGMTVGGDVDSINLSGTVSVLESNTLPIEYTSELVSSGNMVSFDFTDTVNTQSRIERVGVEIDYIKGYFGQDSIRIRPEAFVNDIDLFDKFKGSFQLTDPEINIKYQNAYGLPLQFSLNLRGKYNSGEQVSLPPLTTDMQYPVNFDDDPVDGNISYNKNNLPEIVDFLKFPPADSIFYGGIAYSNIAGRPATDNFAKNDSKIVIGLELKLPLSIKSDSISVQDTLKFDSFNKDTTESGGNIEYIIEQAYLKYMLKNSFPLDLNFFVILYDSINDINYDTISIAQLPAAPVDQNDIVIKSQVQEYSGLIAIDDDLIDLLKYNVNKIIYVGKLNTLKEAGVAQSVKILTSYGIEFRTGLKAQVTIRTK